MSGSFFSEHSLLLAAAVPLISEADSSHLTLPAVDVSPPVMLATEFKTTLPVDHYLISEKLDGVRAFWNGTAFLTRQGHEIKAPDWFTSGLPDVRLDGELWIGRQRFAEVSGIVRREQPDDDWKRVRYVIFDLPEYPGVFSQRSKQLTQLVAKIDQPWIAGVDYFQLSNLPELESTLKQLSQAGAEGLMLHHKKGIYQAGRSTALLKYKLYQDAEAVVVGYTPGKGQFSGMTGALVVRLSDGRQMKIGSGLSHSERRNPPAKGSTITYRFNGYTTTGLPRFARFMRVRDDVVSSQPEIQTE